MCNFAAVPTGGITALTAGPKTRKTKNSIQDMKKTILLTALCLCLVLGASAQQRIKMGNKGYQFIVTPQVGGVELSMTWDTGSSLVVINSEAAARLREAGVLHDADLIGRRTFTTADGRQTECDVVILRGVNFYGIDLGPVEAAIMAEPGAEMLFGMSAIRALEPYERKANVLLVQNPEHARAYSDSLYRHIWAETMIDRDSTEAALRAYAELVRVGDIQTPELYNYVWLMYRAENYSGVVSALRGITDWTDFDNRQLNIHQMLAESLFRLDSTAAAIAPYRRAVTMPEMKHRTLAQLYNHLGTCCMKNDDHEGAALAFGRAIDEEAATHKVDFNYMLDDCMGSLADGQPSHRTTDTDYNIFYYLTESMQAGRISESAFWSGMAGLLRHGNIYARSRMAPWMKRR